MLAPGLRLNHSATPAKGEISILTIERELLINPNGYAEVNEEIRVKGFLRRRWVEEFNLHL